MASDSYEEKIRRYLLEQDAGKTTGKKMALDPKSGKFVVIEGESDPAGGVPEITAEDMRAFAVHWFFVIADLAASGIVGSAAYALLTSNISKFRSRITKSKSRTTEVLTKDEALGLALGLVGHCVNCDPYSLELTTRLRDADNGAWIITLAQKGKRIWYRVTIPSGDPEVVECTVERMFHSLARRDILHACCPAVSCCVMDPAVAAALIAAVSAGRVAVVSFAVNLRTTMRTLDAARD
jgi:hypothetical protein